MDSLSSGPGNRNNTKSLLSAVFAIAASISGSVNAATAPTPKFTDEPAGSPKILDVAKAQQAILDMLPADHKSRPGIAAAIKSLEDGGSVQELTNLFIWAKTIVDSPMAPPAAKEKAKEIITTLTPTESKKQESVNVLSKKIIKSKGNPHQKGSKVEFEIPAKDYSYAIFEVPISPTSLSEKTGIEKEEDKKTILREYLVSLESTQPQGCAVSIAFEGVNRKGDLIIMRTEIGQDGVLKIPREVRSIRLEVKFTDNGAVTKGGKISTTINGLRLSEKIQENALVITGN